MDRLHRRRVRAAVARRWARDLLPVRRSEAHGRFSRRGSAIRHSQTIVPNTRARERECQPRALRSQPRRPAVPGQHAPRPGALTDYRGTQLDRDAEEVTGEALMQRMFFSCLAALSLTLAGFLSFPPSSLGEPSQPPSQADSARVVELNIDGEIEPVMA